jgi:hypothetical protein
MGLPGKWPRQGILTVWLVALLATQAWPGIDEGIRIGFAADASVYRPMAEASPGLPEGPIRAQHAERWVVHWLVGAVADSSGVELETVYRIASVAAVAGVVVLLHLLLVGLPLSPGAYAACLGSALASPYPFRYWLAAPGHVADAVFGLGIAVALLGLARGRLWIVILGLAVGTAARQTALPAALVLAVFLAIRPLPSAARFRSAAAVAVVPLVVYGVVKGVAASFSVADLPPLAELTVLADGPQQIASHSGRVLLGIIFPLAVLTASAWWNIRSALGPLLVAAAIVAQPLVLTADWVDTNEPRLAGLGVPALAVGAAMLVGRIRIGAATATVVCVALFAGSLHHVYSRLDLGRVVWVGLAALVAALTAAALVAARLRSEPIQREAPVAVGDR